MATPDNSSCCTWKKTPDIARKTSCFHDNIFSQQYLFSCTVESLFLSIPVIETINYFLYRICVCKETKPFCKKSTSEKLLLKLTREFVFSVNNKLIKQMDRCPMENFIFVVFSDIYVPRIKDDIDVSVKPHYVYRLNSYYPNNNYDKLLKN